MKRHALSHLALLSILTLSLVPGFAMGIEPDDREREEDERMEREERAEARDHALRRARAFHDMYADEYGRIDVEQKLRAAWLNQIESREAGRRGLAINGSTWSNLGPTNFAGRVAMLAVDPANSSWDPLESTCRHASLSIL